ncbi:hypothetical protein CLOM_g19971 [Closterium sp. NIES-68]|nr:hypothetical protein CLOM_g19971 [Closterium sp. NIES-68]GJP67163.1 hypothetical protein CLOP_g24022 [Closterium sp. NIES-67]
MAVEADARDPSSNLPREDEAEDEGSFFEASLFVDTSYVLHSFSFNDIHVPLYCLAAATTDYDLTGQIVWPGATILAEYLTARPDVVAGKTVIEVGAGTGLAGLMCAHLGSRAVTLTDHNSEVLQVVQRNADHHTQLFAHSSGCEPQAAPSLECAELEWASQKHLEAILAAHPTGFDIVIGADICYQQCHVPPLFTCIKSLLSARQHAISAGSLPPSQPNTISDPRPSLEPVLNAAQESFASDGLQNQTSLPPSCFILAYVERHLSTTRVVWEAARARGLHLEVIEGTERMAPDGFHHARIYKATLASQC